MTDRSPARRSRDRGERRATPASVSRRRMTTCCSDRQTGARLEATRDPAMPRTYAAYLISSHYIVEHF